MTDFEKIHKILCDNKDEHTLKAVFEYNNDEETTMLLIDTNYCQFRFNENGELENML